MCKWGNVGITYKEWNEILLNDVKKRGLIIHSNLDQYVQCAECGKRFVMNIKIPTKQGKIEFIHSILSHKCIVDKITKQWGFRKEN